MRNQDVLFVRENSRISRVGNIPPPLEDSKDKDKMSTLAKASDSILFKASTVFPFTFFIDSIIIDKTKLTIVERLFFFHQDIRSYLIEDILNVDVGISMFFSTLTCITRYDTKKVFTLNYLRKSDASFAKKLIQGLIIAKREGVHIEELSKEEIMTYGEAIGKGDQQE